MLHLMSPCAFFSMGCWGGVFGFYRMGGVSSLRRGGVYP